ncbi:hypothetical protein M885DRAFT_616702 [Pelagophyceae sp. CCMP2097]|nr:hypothetical protein M885DRAFT_616702 [Pelagophyceae sp. CCMP2097]
MVIAMDDKDPTPEEIAEFKIISAKRMAEAAENRKYDRGAFYEREIGFLMREVRESLDQQLFDEAVDASLRLRSLATEAYGETRSPVLASALNDAGLAHKGRGEYVIAIQLIISSIQMYESCKLGEHSSCATALHNLGAAYKDHAQMEGATGMEKLQLLDRAVECFEESKKRRTGKNYDEKRDATLLGTTHIAHATVLRMRKIPKEVILAVLDLGIKALRTAHAINPYRSNKTALAAALNNKALFGRQDGVDAKVVSRLYAEALEIREEALGPTHPVVITTLHNIAEHLLHQGKEAESRRIQLDIMHRMGVDPSRMDLSLDEAAAHDAAVAEADEVAEAREVFKGDPKRATSDKSFDYDDKEIWKEAGNEWKP